MLLRFGSPVELLLECLLVKRPPPRLVLARVILDLHLGAVGDEVVGVAAVEAAFLLSTTAMALAVVVEPVDHQCQLVVSKHLNLLLSDVHQRRQGKQSG